jgi:hypothetical protein
MRLTDLTEDLFMSEAPSATAQEPVSGVQWFAAEVGNGYPNIYAYVALTVDDKCETTAGVTVSGDFPGAPVPVPFSQFVTWGDGVVNAYYQSTGKGLYAPGKTYTLTTVTSKGTLSATAKAPGRITQAADGSGSSWVVDGAWAHVTVKDSSNHQVYRTPVQHIYSPFIVPPYVYSSGQGNYKVITTVSNHTDVLGCPLKTYFRVMDRFQADVQK